MVWHGITVNGMKERGREEEEEEEEKKNKRQKKNDGFSTIFSLLLLFDSTSLFSFFLSFKVTLSRLEKERQETRAKKWKRWER